MGTGKGRGNAKAGAVVNHTLQSCASGNWAVHPAPRPFRSGALAETPSLLTPYPLQKDSKKAFAANHLALRQNALHHLLEPNISTLQPKFSPFLVHSNWMLPLEKALQALKKNPGFLLKLHLTQGDPDSPLSPWPRISSRLPDLLPANHLTPVVSSEACEVCAPQRLVLTRIPSLGLSRQPSGRIQEKKVLPPRPASPMAEMHPKRPPKCTLQKPIHKNF